MATHAAIVTVAPRAPLELHQVPTPKPSGNEVQIRNDWVTSGPLDLHKADGALLVKHPEILGSGNSGTVIGLGPDVQHLSLGDKVFGHGWRGDKEKADQEIAVLPENLLGKIPKGLSMQEAAAIPTNFVTVFHTLTTHFDFLLPHPKPEDWTPDQSQTPILVWGGSSSVGQYAIQILRYYNYKFIIAVSSSRHHARLLSLGATNVLDYNAPFSNLKAQLETIEANKGKVKFYLDCIGSSAGSIVPISHLASAGSKVAVMLPVILQNATEDAPPLYSMEVEKVADWKDGVEAKGVRTHFYLENKEYAEKLQSIIMPDLIEQGVVKANEVRIVEGHGILERAQRALDLLRTREVSGVKLVWKVWEGKE